MELRSEKSVNVRKKNNFSPVAGLIKLKEIRNLLLHCNVGWLQVYPRLVYCPFALVFCVP